MSASLQVIACGTAVSQAAVAANVSAALLSRNLCSDTMPSMLSIEVPSTNEQVQLQAATRHCMHAATKSNKVTVALCTPNDDSATGSKRKREDDVCMFVYVVVAPVSIFNSYASPGTIEQ